MSKLAVFLLVAMICVGDLCFINFVYLSRAKPPSSPPPVNVELIYMQQISSVLGQAEAAMHAGDPERAAMLHLKAANLCVAARDVLKSHADAFDPSTSAFLASQEWKLAHPDSAHVFDQVVDLLLKDNASPDTHPSTHP